MRQLFIDKGILTIKQVAEPLLDDYSVIVQVHYSCISSGTEQATIAAAAAQKSMIHNVPEKIKKILQSVAQHGIQTTTALVKEKLNGSIYSLGYSCSGQVIATGKKVISLQTGDYVACAGAGYAHHADIICVPEHLAVKVTDKACLDVASSATLGAIALQGIRRADIQIGDIVCIIGLGLLGQYTVQLAKQAGATVFGIDLLDERLYLAKECGSDRVYNAHHQQDIEQEIAFVTHHQGVDVTIITASSTSNGIIRQAIALTRKKGKVVLVGDVGLGLERNPLYSKEIDFLISCSYGPGRYDPKYEQQGNDYPYAYVRWTEHRNMQAVISFIESKKLQIKRIVPEIFNLSEAINAYEKIQKQQILGAILAYQDDHEILPSSSKQKEKKRETFGVYNTFIPAKKISPLRVGIIGAGGFAKVKLLPIISQIKHTTVDAIVDVNNAQALTIARSYKVAHVLADDRELFTADLIDVAVIASPHSFHADQALRALEHGKAVFLEKPMVTTFDQLNTFKKLLDHTQNLLLCVDYNRSFSPFMQKIKKVTQERKSPLMVHYRMNAGYIPAHHWVQTDIGAGRIIGEACHIFDLFNFLTDAQPRAISVEAIHGSKDALFPTDNFSVQICYNDGSICTLLYTAIGHVDLGKERMELFFDGKTIVMDDYKVLKGYGLGFLFNHTARVPDKGHDALLRLFFDSIQKDIYEPPIPYDRLCSTAELSLIVDRLACRGGGEHTVN